ncbi:MAG TPA: DUF4381 domain-containing protein [Cellvibrio sp.]|nr:DUF4381 domain-containing protein [Cellvibrio sp.]
MNPQDTLAAQDPLAQLQDIHLPAAIGLWPPAWGWWLLLIAVILILATSIFFLRRRRLRNAYRPLALRELQKIQQQFDPQKSAEYLQAISLLLRRTALSGFAAQFNSSLKGEEWLQWLDQQNPKAKYPFASDAGRVLLIGPYQKQPSIDAAQLHNIVEAWILQHRNQWQQKPANSGSASEVQPHA